MTPFEYVLTSAIILLFFGQGLAIFLIYGSVRRLETKATDLQTRLNPLLAQSHEIAAKTQLIVNKTNLAIDEISLEVRACSAAIAATTVELSRLTVEQAHEVSSFLNEATSSARLQIGRLERVVSVTTDRIEETSEIVQEGIVRPVREVSAIIVGIRRAIEVLFKSERKQINQAYQDEEMFI